MVEDFQRSLIAAQGYCELTMYEDALAELDTIDSIDQEHPMVVEMRLVILMQAKRWPEALRVSEQLCQLRPDAATAFIHAAFCLHELGHTAAARKKLLAGPSSLQQEANYFYNLACYECVLGDPEAARRHLLTCFAMDKSYQEHAKTDPDLRALRE